MLPHEEIGLHEADTWEINHVTFGQGMKLIGDRTTPFKAGEVVLIPPHIPHCWKFDESVTDGQGRIANICVFLTDELLERTAETFPEMEERIAKLKELDEAISFSNKQAQKIVRLLESMREMNNLQRIGSIMELLLLITEDEGNSVTVGKIAEQNREESFLEQIDTYVICNARRDFKLDDIARHVGMNRTSFCVYFKKLTGKTFVTYLNEYRMESACKLLRESQLTISEICYSAGFNDIPYFNRAFKKAMGVSPTEYRLSATKS